MILDVNLFFGQPVERESCENGVLIAAPVWATLIQRRLNAEFVPDGVALRLSHHRRGRRSGR